MILLHLIITFMVAFYFLRPTKTETAVQQHLENIQESRDEAIGKSILVKREYYGANPMVREIVRQLPGAQGTLMLIQQAGLNWAVANVMGTSVLLALAGAWIASLIFSAAFLTILGAALLGSIPYIYLYFMREARLNKCDKLLPEAIDLMSRALRAGHALPSVLEMVGKEIADPVGTEFQRLHEETSVGLSLREAVTNFVDRIPRDDARFLGTAILLQKETGGNLAVILDKTAFVARERARLHGQLKIYTAQGRITGWILCIMPFCMFGLLSMLNWNTEKILITDEYGIDAVYAGLVLMVLGILTIRKIIDIKV